MFDRLEILKHKGFSPKFIVDVGAHLGNFALGCKNIWPDVDIHMFEANPYAEDILRSIGFKYNISLLSNKIGIPQTYYMSDEWVLSTGNSVYRENTRHFDDTHLITTELISNTLDNILSTENRSIDLLKLDTQGSEIDILNGAKSLLHKTKYILIECSVYEYNLGGCLVGDVFSFMNDHHFKLEDVVDIQYLQDGCVLNQMDLLFINTKIC